jgi:hypothetical protein
MNLQGFNAETTLYKTGKTLWLSQPVLGGRPLLLPQLGFGGGGVTYPPAEIIATAACNGCAAPAA